MARWLKQNLNLAVVIALMAYFVGGIAVAAVMRSDIERINRQMETMPKAITRLETNYDNQEKVIDRIDKNVSLLINKGLK
mgnify:CR=1 FL=1